jgi:ADP-L-glycero-D-manno-heptose 6-epimerase
MIIVTGAAGFIGSVIVKELNDLGRTDIVIVDHFRDGDKWFNLRGLKYEEIIGPSEFLDILPDLDGTRPELEIEAIYHMGACSATTELDMDYLYRNNVLFSKVLFEHCTEFDIPIAYASSAATYGAGEQDYCDEHGGVESLRPLNKYGYSKQVFDEWALRQEDTPSKWYGLKFFNVYGPNEYHKGRMSSVVYQAFNQINDNGRVKLFKSYKEGFKDGEQLRDFVYVKDVVRAMIKLITSEHMGKNGIYNLGTGKARSFCDLVKATFTALELEPKIDFIEMPTELRDQYQYFTEASMEKLAKALPDFKFNSLEDGVSDYIQNYLNTANKNLESQC